MMSDAFIPASSSRYVYRPYTKKSPRRCGLSRTIRFVNIEDVRLVTASAYAGLMGSLVTHPSTMCVLSGDADTDAMVPPAVGRQSLESLAGVRRRWQAGDVAGLADLVPNVLADTPADRRPILLVAPRVNARWRAAALTWPEVLRPLDRFGIDRLRIAEDKAYVRELMLALGVPVPPSVVIPSAAASFRRAAASVGAPFVMQAPCSAGGQGTYLIADEPGLIAVLTGRSDVAEWLCSGYAGDLTMNISGVVYHDGHQLLPASVQASGIGEVGAAFGAFCGSDFGAAQALPHPVMAEAREHTARLAEWLRADGYRGLFGVDIAVDGDRISFLEINPRIQGSSWLLDSMLASTGMQGCLEAHVRAVLGAAMPSSSGLQSTLESGTQLIVRWTGPTSLVRSVSPSWNRSLQVTGLPLRDTVIYPGAIVARVASRDALTTAQGLALRPEGRRLVAEIIASVEVSSPALQPVAA
jgi:hypothetical protein